MCIVPWGEIINPADFHIRRSGDGVPWVTVAKIELQMSIYTLYWKVAGAGGGQGVLKDSVSLLMLAWQPL